MTPTDSRPRPVRVLAAGGTIAMRGEQAVPALDGAELVEQLPQVAGFRLEAETVLSLPSTHLSLADALDLARRACVAGDSGEGVDTRRPAPTWRSVAGSCAELMYGGEAPIVITGANRPGARTREHRPGAANLLDAIVLGPSAAGDTGLGVVSNVRRRGFHAAMTVRKIDSTGPVAFGSPTVGPLGRIVEGRVWLHATPRRPAPLPVKRLEHRVTTVTTGLGDDGALLRHAAEISDGVVLIALGAGHLSKEVLAELRQAAPRVPVVITCRPDRSSMLFATYGFEGAELRLLARRPRRESPRTVPGAGRGADGAAVRARRRARPRRHRASAGAIRRPLAHAFAV